MLVKRSTLIILAAHRGLEPNPDFRMRRFRKSLLVVVGLLVAHPSSGLAQKAYALGFGGGASIPVGKLGDAQKTGYNAIVSLAVGVPDLAIGVRLDGIYNNLLRADRTAAQGATSVASNLRVIGVLANFIYAFPGTSAKPYIVVGGGLYNTKADLPGAKSRSDLGFNGGLGATFGLGPFATFIESRYHSVSRKGANGGVFQFVPVTVGLMF